MKLRQKYNEEDVIEETLVNGAKSACIRFKITPQEVVNIVRPFVNEIDGIDGRCDCERANANGESRMCFICTGRTIGRI